MTKPTPPLPTREEKKEMFVVVCPKCRIPRHAFDPDVERGLFDNGEMLLCRMCFEEEKRQFWLKILSLPIKPNNEK